MEIENIALEQSSRLVNHGAVVLLSTTDGTTPNACAVAWCSPARKDPPRFVLTIGKRHKTYDNLLTVEECVLNLPTVEALDQVMICGRRSGHNGDKLKEAGIEFLASEKVRPPRLACCSAWIEARVVATPDIEDTSLVVVEAVATACRKGLLTAEGYVDVARFKTLHHLGDGRFCLPGKVVNGAFP